LDQTSLFIEEGQTATLVATVTGSENAIEWSSSNPEKATVVDGVVTAVSVGSATITATVGDKQATCEVTVTDSVLPVINLNNSSTQIYKGQTLNLNAEVTYGDDVAEDAVIVYESSDETIATVDANGVVTGVAKGSADIILNCTYNGKIATQKVVSISVANLTIVSLNTEDGQELETGDTLTLDAVVSVDGEEISASVLTFSVSDESVASINGNVLTALSAKENLIITATYNDGEDDYTDSISVSIDYAVAFLGAVELSADANEGIYFIETDVVATSATLGGATIDLTAVEGGYTVDATLFDAANANQDIILTDADGVDYLASIVTVLKGDVSSVIGIRPEEAYKASVQHDVYGADRSGVTQISGASGYAWQNTFYIYGIPAAKQNGATYMAFDFYFVQGDQNFVGITDSTNNYYNFTVGQAAECEDIFVYDLEGNPANFNKDTWLTIVINIDAYPANAEGYATGAWKGYFDNVRYMTDAGYECYVNGSLKAPEPLIADIANISLDNAIANPGADYKLTRAAAEDTYLDKTAIKFTGSNDSTWKNNLLINIADYRADYAWIVADFYFNSNDVMFDTVSASYVALPFGVHSTTDAFTAINIVDGICYSVPAVKGAWNTIAFKIDEISGAYLNAIMSGAVDTYVANIMAITAEAMPEIITVSNTIDNSNIYVFDYSANGVAPMTRYDDVAVFGKTGLVQLVGASNGTWHNTFMVSGLTGVKTLKAAGYRYLAVDIMFQSQGVAGSQPGFFYPAGDVISVPLNGTPSSSEIMIFDAAHQPLATFKDNTWTTFVFDLSTTDKDNIQAYAVGASHWFISDCYAMTEGEFTAWKVAPEKVEVEVAGLTTKNITKAVVDGVGGRDGVVQCTGTGNWYDNVVYIPVAQMPNEVYTTFSFDVYFSAEASLFFYFLSSDANSIAMGSGSIEGIQILDADGNETVLATNTWLTVKLDLTKMGYASPQFFASIVGQVMTIDNAYFA